MLYHGAFADFYSPLVPKLSFSVVGKKLPIRAHLQPLYDSFASRMGMVQRALVGTQKNFQVSSMGWIWLGSGTEKSK